MICSKLTCTATHTIRRRHQVNKIRSDNVQAEANSWVDASFDNDEVVMSEQSISATLKLLTLEAMALVDEELPSFRTISLKSHFADRSVSTVLDRQTTTDHQENEDVPVLCSLEYDNFEKKARLCPQVASRISQSGGEADLLAARIPNPDQTQASRKAQESQR